MWWPTASDHVSQDSTVGVYVLSTILAAMFYGLTFLQNLQYFDRYRKDCAAMKFLVNLVSTWCYKSRSSRLDCQVLVVWLFDSTTMVLAMQAVYMFAVARRNVPFATVEVPGSVGVERAFSFAVVFIVQIFFVGRVWQLGKTQWYLSVFIGMISTSAIVVGLAATVQASAFGITNPSHPASIDGLSAAGAGLQIAADVMINASLYWLCSKCKHDDGKGVIRDAFVNSINRGVLSTVLQVLTTITYFANRPRLVWMSFHLTSSKVHAMSLLSVLNTRNIINGVADDAEIADAQLRYRLQRELDGAVLPTRPPIIPSIHQLRSQSSWFATHAKHSDTDDSDAKSAAGMTTLSARTGVDSASASAEASVMMLSRGPSVHARSTTAVDGN
ncbi:hypothetical protein C8Q78DRAFT_1032145 [Trametes maxima]|nr:hypothetical protein C8Q78DRAFT_1032145 [Trametes maxima]